MKKELNIFTGALILILIQSFILNTQSFELILKDIYIAVKPFVYAIFIAILIIPLVRYFEDKLRLKRWFAMTISFFIVAITFLMLILIVVPNIIESLMDLINKTPNLIKSLVYHLEKIIKFLQAKKLIVIDAKVFETSIINFIKTNIGNLKDVLFGVSSGIVKSITFFMNLGLAIFISFYLIFSKEYFIKFQRNMLLIFFDEKKTVYWLEFFKKTNDIFLKYIIGRLLTSALVGIIVFIVLFIARVPYALLSAVMIGVGNMIPYVGSIIAGIVATFLIFLVSPIKVIYLFIAIVVAQTADGFLIGPKIMEESIGMSSFWTIISIMMCGNLFGPIGMFLGVPVFAILKILYTEKIKQTLEFRRKEAKDE